MKSKKNEYLETKSNTEKLIRAELLFAPFLVTLPFFISFLLIWSWYYKGYLAGSSVFDGHLILGFVILFVNIAFDIPFIKSLISYKRR